MRELQRSIYSTNINYMRKTITTAIVIGSIAISAVTVSAASAATNATTSTVTLIQRNLNRQERNQARLNEFAQILGLTPDDLQSQLKSGKQPLQIAIEHGITKDQLKQKMDNYHQRMLKNIRQQLSDQVTAGQLTQEQMDAKLNTIISHGTKKQGWHRRHFGY